MGRKHVEKGENAGYQHFLLFPQCFQKAFFLRVVKSRDCVVKGLRAYSSWALKVVSMGLDIISKIKRKSTSHSLDFKQS